MVVKFVLLSVCLNIKEHLLFLVNIATINDKHFP